MNKETKELTISRKTILFISITCLIIAAMFNPLNKLNAQAAQLPNQIIAFNSKFLQYEGKQSTAKVRVLANVIIANNATITEHIVKFNGIDDSKLIIDSIKELEYNKIYDVKVQYNNNSQYITDVIVSEYNISDVYYDLNKISNSITSNSKEIYELKKIIYIMFGANIVLLFTILILVIKVNKMCYKKFSIF